MKPDVEPSGILQTGGMVDSMMETQNSREGREGIPLPINIGKINPCAREIILKHPRQGVHWKANTEEENAFCEQAV